MTDVVGLTGGIGSGKSTVAELFEKLGTPIIDADLIARDLTETNQPVYLAIIHHFKEKIVLKDGSLDRTKLRQIVFENENERKWLENLLHPLIQEKIEKEIKKISAPYCIVIIPLLFEVTPYHFINRILVVDTPKEQQINRVKLRDRTDSITIEKILQTQVHRQHRLAGADDIIINDGKIADLIPQVKKLHKKYMGA